jgi:oxygen-independent coproporphyrinogen III oxidase
MTRADSTQAPIHAKRAYNWRTEPVGLYLHIPFCESKCIYCDFNSYAHLEDKYEPFVEAMCVDIERGAARWLEGQRSVIAEGETDCDGAVIATVFLGGGTPSVLQPAQIRRVLDAARRRYSLAPGAEITMEANPGTISLDKFEGYLEAGINRLSMGVQVLDDLMLKKLGRIHTAEGALESHRLARQAGFDNVNLDFIFGLPGQDLAHLDRMLDRLLAVSPLPEHLSCYSLIVEEHTPLYVGVERGLITVPGEDEVADMYELIRERLAACGYEQYEISNWSRARPCDHNLVYWHDQRYLAFGPGASGYWGDVRYSTILSPAEYIDRVARNSSVVREWERVGPRGEMGEFMMLGMRLVEGVRRSEFARRFGLDLDEVFGEELRELEALDLVESREDIVRLSRRGTLLGNEVFAKFVA